MPTHPYIKVERINIFLHLKKALQGKKGCRLTYEETKILVDWLTKYEGDSHILTILKTYGYTEE